MVDLEITRKRRLTRKQAGERLIALGQALADGPTSEVGFDGDSIRFRVADHVEWEFELEVEGEEVQLELELTWSDAPARSAESEEPEPPSEPEAPAVPAAPAARRRTKTTRRPAGG
jgi:amphi-Trp domain-containing protein